MNDESYQLTVKGAVMSALFHCMSNDSAEEVAEVILDVLYRNARRRCEADNHPAIVFDDGQWVFVDLIKEL